jgi:hypothetical protein
MVFRQLSKFQRHTKRMTVSVRTFNKKAQRLEAARNAIGPSPKVAKSLNGSCPLLVMEQQMVVRSQIGNSKGR